MINFLVLLGIISLLASFFTGTLLQQGKFQGAQDAQLAARTIRYNITNHIQNDEAWTKTADDANNTSLECLRNHATCPKSPSPIARLKNAAGDDVVSSETGKGFNMNGAPCTTYASSGSPECPFRVEITWEPICSGAGPCPSSSMVRLSFKVLYSTSAEKGHVFNASKHDFTIERSSLK